MKINKIIGLFILLALGLQSYAVAGEYIAAANTAKKNKKLDAQVESRRIPKGARLKVKLLDPVSTKTSNQGEMFNSMLVTDTTVDKVMILPSGTLLRGYIQEIKPAKFASIGAVLYLKFDHIVTPSGTQLPLKSTLSYNNDAKITIDGGMRLQTGYGDALKDNWHTTQNIVSKSTEWGLGKDNMAAKIILTPIGAVGGTIGGAFYLVGDSVIDLFRKGKQVSLNQDDVIEIIILKDLDVPVI